MEDINKVIEIGKLTRDVEIRYTKTGFPIGAFSIAVNHRKKSGDTWTYEVDFFDCQITGKTAEALSQWLTKGKRVAVEGRLRQDRWEQDGQKRSKVFIDVFNVQLLDAKGQASAHKLDNLPF